MAYAKYISNLEIEFAPKNKGSVINYDTNIELLTQDGYKPYIESEKPITNRKYHGEYENNENDITLVYVYDETQEEADARELEAAKESKYSENESKADEKRYMQEFTVEVQEKECVFDTSSQTQTDLLTAFAVCSTGSTYDGWVTNNGVELDLTLEDVALISGTFKELSNVYPTWKHYKELIDTASTIEEVEAIEIDYNIGE